MKSRMILWASIVLIAAAALVSTGCGTMMMPMGGATTTSAQSNYQSEGVFGSHYRTPVKDFSSMGIVFAENSFQIATGNYANKEISGEVFTYQSLLKEAQRLGADAIINVVIDRRFDSVRNNMATFQRETWYGSALAIKYTDTIKLTVTETKSNSTGESTTTSSERIFFNGESDASSVGGAAAAAATTPAAEETPAAQGPAGGLRALFGGR